MSQWLESLNVKSSLKERTAVLFPSARARPYSMYGGEMSRVWHDRRELHISAWEDREWIADMARRLDTLISQVCQTWQLGRQRVALGGFRETSLLTFSVYFSLHSLNLNVECSSQSGRSHESPGSPGPQSGGRLLLCSLLLPV